MLQWTQIKTAATEFLVLIWWLRVTATGRKHSFKRYFLLRISESKFLQRFKVHDTEYQRAVLKIIFKITTQVYKYKTCTIYNIHAFFYSSFLRELQISLFDYHITKIYYQQTAKNLVEPRAG